MVSKDEAKTRVKELVEEFSEFSKVELDKKSEIQIQTEFIDELFKALGWDMRKDVEREERVLKGRADYIFRLGNQEALVVEAKKTSVSLGEDQGRQAVSYAYHRKIKFSVLTNFKYLRVYHALSNIKHIDKNLLFWIEFKDFEKRFDELWLLSRENFENEELNKLIPKKDERAHKSIDESILVDLLQFREWLSKDLKSKRVQLGKEQIDEIVQILIDRLIFMRSVEDRGLEGKDFLLKILEDVKRGLTDRNLWALLKTQFERFDKTYNSKLFAPGLLEVGGFFDDSTLIKVINGLYYGTNDHQERYMFDEIPGDLFGNIYEQYLGTILGETEKRVGLKSGTGKRKKMGIYYTPSYIVDYIVKNTVGEYIKDKSIDEILEVRIVDPACGSGSFLIRAFREVCDVIEKKLKSGEKAEKWDSFKHYKDKLTFAQKSSILRNCIYGVDLDEKAVELAQLNLLLKLLEEEDRSLKNRRLPSLLDNIKNGNSLIDDTKIAGHRAFHWEARFPEIFKGGGFDVVVGNPPYVSQKGKGDSPNIEYNERAYFRQTYKTLSENKLKTRGGVKLNLFGLWIERATNILNKEGVVGLIVHKNLLKVESYKFLRKYLLDNTSIVEIVDLGAAVFEGVTGETIIVTISNNNVKDNKVRVKTNVDLQNNIYDEDLISQNKFYDNPDFTFNIYENSFISNLKIKASKNSMLLSDLYKIVSFGLNTKDNKKYFIDEKINSKYKEAVRGRNISKWIVKSFGYVFYDKKVLTRAGDVESFDAKEKLIMQRIGSDLIAAYDENGLYCYNSTNMILPKDENYKLKYLLAILNSKFMNFYYKNLFSMNSKLTVNITQGYLSQIPIHVSSEAEQQKIVEHVDQMLELQKMVRDENIVGRERDRIEEQIKSVDWEIDKEVCGLYGLSAEEIGIVGGG